MAIKRLPRSSWSDCAIYFRPSRWLVISCSTWCCVAISHSRRHPLNWQQESTAGAQPSGTDPIRQHRMKPIRIQLRMPSPISSSLVAELVEKADPSVADWTPTGAEIKSSESKRRSIWMCLIFTTVVKELFLPFKRDQRAGHDSHIPPRMKSK